jgi:hypothetical protein
MCKAAVLLGVLALLVSIAVLVMLKKVTFASDVCEDELRSVRSIIRLWIGFAIVTLWLSIPAIPLEFILAENK